MSKRETLDINFKDFASVVWKNKEKTRESAKKLKAIFNRRPPENKPKRIITIDPVSRQVIAFNMPKQVYNENNINKLNKLMDKLDKLKKRVNEVRKKKKEKKPKEKKPKEKKVKKKNIKEKNDK